MPVQGTTVYSQTAGPGVDLLEIACAGCLPGNQQQVGGIQRCKGIRGGGNTVVVQRRHIAACELLVTEDKSRRDRPGSEQHILTAWMLASWEHHTARGWDYHIHDDGTLTEDEGILLKNRF